MMFACYISSSYHLGVKWYSYKVWKNTSFINEFMFLPASVSHHYSMKDIVTNVCNIIREVSLYVKRKRVHVTCSLPWTMPQRTHNLETVVTLAGPFLQVHVRVLRVAKFLYCHYDNDVTRICHNSYRHRNARYPHIPFCIHKWSLQVDWHSSLCRGHMENPRIRQHLKQ